MCKPRTPSRSQPSGLLLDEAQGALESGSKTCSSGRRSPAPVTPLLGTASVARQQERAMSMQTGQVKDFGSSSPSPTSANQLVELPGSINGIPAETTWPHVT